MLKWKGKQRHWNLSGWGWNPGLAISGQALELTGFYTKRRKYLFQVYSGRKRKRLSGNLQARGGLWWYLGVLCKSPDWMIALVMSWLCHGDTKVCSNLPFSPTLQISWEEDMGVWVGSHGLPQSVPGLSVWRFTRWTVDHQSSAATQLHVPNWHLIWAFR